MMPKPKLLRRMFVVWLVILVAVAMGVTIAAVRGSVAPPPPEVQQPTPLSDVDPAAARDRAKGIYEGPLGEFLVTPREAAAYPPCPLPPRRAENYQVSELYSPAFGENLEVNECADGTLMDFSFYAEAAFGRRYFVGPVKVPFEAPFDRLVLLTVGGHSALAQLQMPAYPGSLRLAVIERFPSGHEPGILVWIDNTHMSLIEAAALAAQIMGVRP